MAEIRERKITLSFQPLTTPKPQPTCSSTFSNSLQNFHKTLNETLPQQLPSHQRALTEVREDNPLLQPLTTPKPQPTCRAKSRKSPTFPKTLNQTSPQQFPSQREAFSGDKRSEVKLTTQTLSLSLSTYPSSLRTQLHLADK